ncbi:MAG: His/Gly/Thr/Pro-type tRNA ligase C-terminal domain-containing protein [Kiritimatiellales bacterium]
MSPSAAPNFSGRDRPSCGVTIDFQTLEDQTVTLRDRDTMQQIRVGIDELERIIEERVRF